MIRWLALLLISIACVVTGREAHAEPLRILVAAGHGGGLPGERPLHHARADARGVREVFTSIGSVTPSSAIVVDEPTPEQLFAALDRARALAQMHRPEEVTLVFYFSGHGDHDAIHLGDRVLPLTDLAARIGTVPAALKIVVVDACRTMQLRPKGISTEPAFAISLTPPAAAGAVWLHASADGEAAQESDELGGAIFTHYWIDGLRGAADNDGDRRVTLSESYDFAYHQTLYRSARGAGVIQRPAVSFALKESNPIVLTETARDASSLLFPQSADTQYVVYGLGSRTVVGEVWSRPDRAVAFAVPSGRYVIQRRASSTAGALEVALGRGEQRAVRAAEFRAFEAEALAQKGGDLLVWPNESEIAYGVRTGRLYDFGQSLRARYAYRLGEWALSLGADLGIGVQTTPVQDARVLWGGVSARVEWRKALGDVELRLGAGPAAQAIAQRLRRTDADRVALAGYATEKTYRAIAIGGEAIAGGRYRFGPRLAMGLDLDVSALVAGVDGSPKLYGSGGVAGVLDFGF